MTKEGDALKPIVDYLDRNLAKGYKLEDLKWALVNQKHSRIEIEKAIKIIEAKMPKPKPVMIEKPVEVAREEVVMPEKKGFWKRIFG